MANYETLPPNNFLGLDEEHSAYDRSAALILPIPYEGTVSYGQGTREGPRAILAASHQVELVRSHRVAESILQFARDHQIDTIVLGRSSHARRRLLGGDLVDRVQRGCGAIEVCVIVEDS